MTDADSATCSQFGQCFTCQVDWGGQRSLIDYTTSNTPAWMPAGTGSAVLSLTSGGQPAFLAFGLNQVNMNAMQGLTVYEAQSNILPARADQADIDSRAYVTNSDDRVPLVPQFTYGIDTYPSPPAAYITYSGTWDTGDPLDITQTSPYPGGLPGNAILLIKIPGMKSGNHKITLKATLPSGKTFTAPGYQVFVYNAALEASINGGAFNTGSVTFERASNVVFRINQQDAKGKTLKITAATWKFHNLLVNEDVLGSDDGLAADATQWGGTMVQSGLLSAQVTLQVGKTSRTSHAGVALTAIATPRPGGTWQTVQNLCDNCFDDLGIKGGGILAAGLVLPTDLNIQDIPQIPQAQSALALGMSGDRLGYQNGIIPDSLVSALDSHTVLKPYPLYRPLNNDNDPGDWPNRYTVAQVASGPNRTYRYVTQQNFHTEWSYAVSAYFYQSSAPGAQAGNYFSFVFDPSCGNAADAACYVATPLSCWASAHPGQSYFNAATAAGFSMPLLMQEIQTHEKQRHWTQFLVNFVASNKDQYDIGTLMERQAILGGSETDFRAKLDLLVRTIDANYVMDPNGGAGEVTNDPKEPFPFISDLPVGNANCNLHQ